MCRALGSVFRRPFRSSLGWVDRYLWEQMRYLNVGTAPLPYISLLDDNPRITNAVLPLLSEVDIRAKGG